MNDEYSLEVGFIDRPEVDRPAATDRPATSTKLPLNAEIRCMDLNTIINGWVTSFINNSAYKKRYFIDNRIFISEAIDITETIALFTSKDLELVHFRFIQFSICRF